jgi:hypothetical protein
MKSQRINKIRQQLKKKTHFGVNPWLHVLTVPGPHAGHFKNLTPMLDIQSRKRAVPLNRTQITVKIKS